MSDRIQAELGLVLNEGDLAKIKAQIKGLEKDKIKISMEIDDKGLKSSIAKAEKQRVAAEKTTGSKVRDVAVATEAGISKERINTAELTQSEIDRIENRRLKTIEDRGKKEKKQIETQAKAINSSIDAGYKEQQRLERKQSMDSERAAIAQQKARKVNWNQVGYGMSNAGTGLLTMSAPILAIGALGAKAAISFESSFAGVRKTVDASEERLLELQTNIRNMAKEMPTSANEIAKVMENAGQLGIQTDQLEHFTKTMVMLGDTTNLSADEAATSLARFANITQMDQGNFDKLGATIVHLGNNFATTEAEIVDMGLRIAGAGSQVGMSEAKILALSTAMSSLGLQSEQGGTAVSKSLINMANAVANGGEELEGFAKVAGMTGEQFQQAFKEDAAGAFTSFIEGLSKGDALQMLDELGIKEVRLRDTMLRLAQGSNLLKDSLKMSEEAWSSNSALVDEANKRYETTESKLLIMKNRLIDVGMNLGVALLPTLIQVAEKITALAEKFASLDPATQGAIMKFALFTAGLGAFLKISGGAVSTIANIAKGFGELSKLLGGGAKIAGATGEMAGLSGAVGGLGVASVGAVAGVGLLATAIGVGLYKGIQNARESQAELDNLIANYANIQTQEIEAVRFGEVNYDEFMQLQGLIGANGDMTAMTAEQQARYNQLLSEYVQKYPELQTATNEMGQMYATEADHLRTLIELKKQEIELNQKRVRAETADKFDEYGKDIEESSGKRDYYQNKINNNMKEIEAIMSGKKDPPNTYTKDSWLAELKKNNEDWRIKVEIEDSKIKSQLSELKQGVEAIVFDGFNNAGLSQDNAGVLNDMFGKRLDSAKTQDEINKIQADALRAEEIVGNIGSSLKSNDYTLDALDSWSQALQEVGLSAEQAGQMTTKMVVDDRYTDIMDQWNNTTLEDKQFVAETMGLEDVEQFTAEAFIKWAAENPDKKEFVANIIGIEDIDVAIATMNEWNGLSEEEKQAIASVEGMEFLKDGTITLQEWNAMPTETKELLMKLMGKEDIISGVEEAKKSAEKEPIDVKAEVEVNTKGKKSVGDVIADFFGGNEAHAAEMDVDVNFNANVSGKDEVINAKNEVDAAMSGESPPAQYNFIQLGGDQVIATKAGVDGAFNTGGHWATYMFQEYGSAVVMGAKQATDSAWGGVTPVATYTATASGLPEVTSGAEGLFQAWSPNPPSKTFTAIQNGIPQTTGYINSLRAAWNSLQGGTKVFTTINRTVNETVTKKNWKGNNFFEGGNTWVNHIAHLLGN